MERIQKQYTPIKPIELIKFFSYGLMLLACLFIVIGSIWTVSLPYVDMDLFALPSWTGHTQVPPLTVKNIYLSGWILFVASIFSLTYVRYVTNSNELNANKTRFGVALTSTTVGFVMIFLWILFMFPCLLTQWNINIENKWFTHDGQMLYDMGFVGIFGILAFVFGSAYIFKHTTIVNVNLAKRNTIVNICGALSILIGFAGMGIYYISGRFMESSDPMGSLKLSNFFLCSGELFVMLGSLLLIISYINKQRKLTFYVGTVIIAIALIFSLALQSYSYAALDTSSFGDPSLENAWEYFQYDMNGTFLAHMQYLVTALVAIGFTTLFHASFFLNSKSIKEHQTVPKQILKTFCVSGILAIAGISTMTTTSCSRYASTEGIQIPPTLAIPTTSLVNGQWVDTTKVHESYAELIDGLFLMKYRIQDELDKEIKSIVMIELDDSWIKIVGAGNPSLPVIGDIHSFFMGFLLTASTLIPGETHDVNVNWIGYGTFPNVIKTGNCLLHFEVYDLSWYPYDYGF